MLAAIAASAGNDDEPAAVVEEINAAGVEGPRSPYKGAVRPQAPPGEFALRDQDGELVRLADLRGTVVVLSPTYATCDETCPVAAQQIRGALDDLSAAERERIRAFALSVDPANDTPDRAQEFLLGRRLRGYLDYLLGTPPGAAAGVARVRVRPADGRARAQLLRGAAGRRGPPARRLPGRTSSRPRRWRTTCGCWCAKPRAAARATSSAARRAGRGAAGAAQA